MTPRFTEALTSFHLTRRRLLQVGAGAALSAVPLLAACGGDDDDDEETPAAATATTGAGATPTSGSGGEATPTSGGGAATTPTTATGGEATATLASGPTATTGGTTGEGVQGGTFTAAISGTPPSLDFMTSPYLATRFITRPTIENLVTYAEDFSITPMLAESYEVNADATEFAFTLREGITFHNGKALTTEDVVATWDRFLTVTPRLAQFENLDTYSASDDLTIVFALKEPQFGFLENVAFPLNYPGVLPSEVVSTIEETNAEVEHLVGTGPYKFVEFEPDQVVRFE
jgi:ABC-type transport system substrate-binding protein